MDSVNLSDGQSSPLNCKCHVFTRNPAGCACCGLTDYPKNIPPAYCFTTLYPGVPGVPSCKHCQDHLPDSFPIPHSFFSSFPFQQQFYHSPITSPSYYCQQKLLNDEAKTQSPADREKARRPALKKESPISNNSKTAPKTTQKHKQALKPETYPNDNSFFQRCVCGDATPRPCSPFIVPVFSYCLFWNSQSPTLPAKSYNGCLTENGNGSEENLDVLREPQEVKGTGDSQANLHCMHETLTVIKLTGDELKKEEKTVEEDVNRVTSDSLKCADGNDCKNVEQDEMNECLASNSDESDEEDVSEDEAETGDDVELKDRTDSEECLIQNEGDAEVVLDLNANSLKGSDCHKPLERHSSSDFKSTAKSSEFSIDASLSENQENFWAADVDETNLVSASNDATEGLNSDAEDLDVSKTTYKKCIKNFTVTNEIAADVTEEEQIPAAAAGDLGGESCCDYNPKISKPSDAKPETAPEEKSKELCATDTRSEEKEVGKVSDKTAAEILEENQSSGQKQKSGIAKFLNNSNSKAVKTNALKNTKNSKNDSNQKQNTLTAHKHCCFPVDNINSLHDSRQKVLKPKNCGTIQRQVLGSEKQQKPVVKSQFLRKGTFSQKSVRAVSGFQKSEKTSLKK